MSEFVKKTVMGYKPVPGGQSDLECTHAILTLQEYNELLKKLSAAEQDARAARRKADKDILAVKEDASREVYRASQEAQERVDAIQGELEAERRRAPTNGH